MSHHREPFHKPVSGGFTLVELMIAMVITIIIASMIFTVFNAQAASYRRQEDLAKTQQNLRLAMEIVARDMGMAGFGFSTNGQAWGVRSSTAGSDEGPLVAVNVIQNWNGTGTDAVEVAYLEPDQADWAVAWDDLPPSCNTTSVTFRSVDATKAATFAAGDQIACYDPGGVNGPRAFAWAVSGAGNASDGVIPVTENTQSDYSAHCTDTAGLAREMSCGKLSWLAYYIDADDAGGGPGTAEQPALMLSFDQNYPTSDDIPIALGIEDLQFDVCVVGNECRDTGDYQNDVDTRGPDVTGNSADPDFYNLQSVTIRMLARSLRRDTVNSSVSRRVDISTDDAVDTSNSDADGFHRRIGSTMVSMRNSATSWSMSQTY